MDGWRAPACDWSTATTRYWCSPIAARPFSSPRRSALNSPLNWPADRSAPEFAAATEVRALLPLREFDARATPVRRRNGEDKIVAAATIYERLADDGRPLAAPWVIEVDALTGYDKAATGLVAVLDGMGLRSRDGDVFDLTGPVDGPGRHLSSPTIAAGPEDCRQPKGSGLVLANLAEAITLNCPGRSTTSTPSSCTTYASPCVARARFCRNAAACSPPTCGRARRTVRLARRRHRADRAISTLQARVVGLHAAAPHDGRARARRAPTSTRLRARAPTNDWPTCSRGEETARTAGVVDAVARHPVDPATTSPKCRRADRESSSARIVAAQRQLLDRRPGDHARHARPSSSHELRKDAKRLRYLLECFGGLSAPTARKAFVQRLKALQDNLGEHQDAEVHVDAAAAVVAELPRRTARRDVRSPSASSSSSSSGAAAAARRVRRPVRRVRQQGDAPGALRRAVLGRTRRRR